MKIEFYKSLSDMDDRECIEKFLLYNTALIISGGKPSATITLRKENDNLYDKWIKYGDGFLNSINLKYKILRERENSLILLIYNENQLKSYILKEEHKNFLMKIGYSSEENIEEYVDNLKERYDQYKCPHELGIFLGFPLEDVKDFMECTDKKCLACGYWKVYNNYNEAKKIFDKYDRVKERTIKYILNGDTTYNVACNIRNLFNSYEGIPL